MDDLKSLAAQLRRDLVRSMTGVARLPVQIFLDGLKLLTDLEKVIGLK